jgi:hypothetical protein
MHFRFSYADCLLDCVPLLLFICWTCCLVSRFVSSSHTPTLLPTGPETHGLITCQTVDGWCDVSAPQISVRISTNTFPLQQGTRTTSTMKSKGTEELIFNKTMDSLLRLVNIVCGWAQKRKACRV